MAMNHIGGKLMVFQCTLPSLGSGRLLNRGDDHRNAGTDKEHQMRAPADPFFKKISAECSRQQICVDVFASASPCGSRQPGGAPAIHRRAGVSLPGVRVEARRTQAEEGAGAQPHAIHGVGGRCAACGAARVPGELLQRALLHPIHGSSRASATNADHAYAWQPVAPTRRSRRRRNRPAMRAAVHQRGRRTTHSRAHDVRARGERRGADVPRGGRRSDEPFLRVWGEQPLTARRGREGGDAAETLGGARVQAAQHLRRRARSTDSSTPRRCVSCRCSCCARGRARRSAGIPGTSRWTSAS